MGERRCASGGRRSRRFHRRPTEGTDREGDGGMRRGEIAMDYRTGCWWAVYGGQW